MAQWQRTIDFKHFWDKASDREITPQQTAGLVAKELKKVNPFGIEEIDEELKEIIEEFEYMSKDEDELTFDDFDCILESLYDWADTPLDENFFGGKKVAWIKTL